MFENINFSNFCDISAQAIGKALTPEVAKFLALSKIFISSSSFPEHNLKSICLSSSFRIRLFSISFVTTITFL